MAPPSGSRIGTGARGRQRAPQGGAIGDERAAAKPTERNPGARHDHEFVAPVAVHIAARRRDDVAFVVPEATDARLFEQKGRQKGTDFGVDLRRRERMSRRARGEGL